MNDLNFCSLADPKSFGFDSFLNINYEIAENSIEAVKFKNKKVLILIKDFLYDEGSIRQIAENKKACFLIDLSQLINIKGSERSIYMYKMRNFLKLCNKFGAYYAFASFSKTENELRYASELCHISMLFDINRGQAEFALKMIVNYK